MTERLWRVFEVLNEIRQNFVAPNTYTTAVLADQLRRKTESLGRTPTDREVNADTEMASASTFLNVFDLPWTTLMKYLGLSLEEYTVSDLKAVLRKITSDLGRAPTVKEVNADARLPSTDQIARKFGTRRWNVVLGHCELAVNIHMPAGPAYTKAALTEQLHEKTRVLGRPPIDREVATDPAMASVATFKRVFGKSWKGVLLEVGLTPNSRKAPPGSQTVESLTAQLLKKAAVLGRTPIDRDINGDPEMASMATFRRVFKKSWNGILKEVGLPPTRRGGSS